jgi:hypothetical protein
MMKDRYILFYNILKFSILSIKVVIYIALYKIKRVNSYYILLLFICESHNGVGPFVRFLCCWLHAFEKDEKERERPTRELKEGGAFGSIRIVYTH